MGVARVRWDSATKQQQHIYLMEYYSDIKKDDIISLAATLVDLETVMSEINWQRSKNIIWYPLYVQSKKK